MDTLHTRPGKPKVWIEPVIDREDTLSISYEIREGGEPTLKSEPSERGNGRCIATGAAIPAATTSSLRAVFLGRMGSQLIASCR